MVDLTTYHLSGLLPGVFLHHVDRMLVIGAVFVKVILIEVLRWKIGLIR